MKNKKNIMMKVVRNSITKIAEKKAYANCIGFMYEPKNPEKYYKSGAVDEDITYGSTFYLN